MQLTRNIFCVDGLDVNSCLSKWKLNPMICKYQIAYLKTAMMIFPLLFFFSIVNFRSQTCALISSSKTTAIFAFGDSIMDSGNNNRLTTVVRSDHPPYGANFPGHVPTGRFSNGRLSTDFVASKLGLKEVLPAYLDPSVTNKDLLTGVSFASGGSGFDDMTAKNSGTLGMKAQIDYFEEAFQRIEREVGGKEAARIVKNAVFAIGAGTNDMMVNFYIMPVRRLTFSVSQYHDFLLGGLKDVILNLYKKGARKLFVTGLPPIGCLPIQMTVDSLLPSKHMLHRACDNELNTDSQAYNGKLQTLLSDLQATLPGAKVVYADIYTPIFEMIKRPLKYGFKMTLEGCCGTGIVEMGPLCNSMSKTCSDPSKFLFWDAVHPTEAMYLVLAKNFERNVFPNLTSTY